MPEETVEERLKTAVLSWARGRSLGKRPGEPFGEVTDPALLDETAAAFEGVAETPNFWRCIILCSRPIAAVKAL